MERISSYNRRPDRKGKFHLVTGGTEFKFTRNQGRAWPFAHPVKSCLSPNEISRFYQNADFLADFEVEYEDPMDSIYYLGPLGDLSIPFIPSCLPTTARLSGTDIILSQWIL